MKLITKTAFLPLLPLLFGLPGCDSSQQATQATGGTPKVEFAVHENRKDFGEYYVHVNALTTDQLPAEVAREYKIARSKSKAMLNVVMTKKTEGIEKPVRGEVKVLARNLASQLKDMPLREIVEQGEHEAIYYIGELPVNHEETIVFEIEATPEGLTEPFLMSYKQQFFTR